MQISTRNQNTLGTKGWPHRRARARTRIPGSGCERTHMNTPAALTLEIVEHDAGERGPGPVSRTHGSTHAFNSCGWEFKIPLDSMRWGYGEWAWIVQKISVWWWRKPPKHSCYSSKTNKSVPLRWGRAIIILLLVMLFTSCDQSCPLFYDNVWRRQFTLQTCASVTYN